MHIFFLFSIISHSTIPAGSGHHQHMFKVEGLICLEGSIIMYASHLRSIKVRYDSALESKLHISVLMQY